MSSTVPVTAIREALIAALQGITTPHSLASTGQVRSGRYARPPAGAGAFACVWLEDVVEPEGEGTMTTREQVGTWSVRVWVPASIRHPEARMVAAEGVLHAVRVALRADRRLGLSYVLRTAMSLSAQQDADGQGNDGAEGFGVVAATIAVHWREAA